MSMEPTLKTPIETMMPFGVPKLGQALSSIPESELTRGSAAETSS